MLRIDAIESLGARAAVMTDMSDGDCSAQAPTARTRLLAALGLDPSSLVAVRQVHGATVLRVPPAPTAPFEADAIVVCEPGWTALVSVADCVPIWLYDPQRRVGGVVHAGREGTFQGVAGAAAAAFPDASDLYAWIGPSAGPCCYEVSEALAQQADSLGVPILGRRLDLWEANRLQLQAAGLRPARIGSSAQCTICGSGFHSHRGQGTSARNAALLAL